MKFLQCFPYILLRKCLEINKQLQNINNDNNNNIGKPNYI